MRANLVALMAATMPAVEFGGSNLYGHFNKPIVIPAATAIAGCADDTIYRTLANRPHFYQFRVAPGSYQVVVHYLSGTGIKGRFSVRVAGREVVPATTCMGSDKDANGLTAAQQRFTAEAGADGLKLYFPRTYDQEYAIAGIELAGGAGFRLLVDCGGSGCTDRAGQTWEADRDLTPGDVCIPVPADAATGTWVDLAPRILASLCDAGIEPVVKWNGLYCRGLNGVIVDRDGSTFLSLSGIGLWSFGTEMRRVDDGRYAAGMMAVSPNPYGRGFVTWNSHGLIPGYPQLFTADGTTFSYFDANLDYGAVDWTQSPPRTLIGAGHHRKETFVSNDGGTTLKKATHVKPGSNLSAMAALPGGALLRCVSADKRTQVATDEVGIWRSVDLGQTWTRVADVDIGHSCFPITTYRDSVYLHGSAGLLISRDAGQTFARVEGAPAFTNPVCLGDTDEQLMGFNAAGGWRSTDRGATWKQVLPPPPALPKQAKFIQDHQSYDYAWNFRSDIVYAYGCDVLWRFKIQG